MSANPEYSRVFIRCRKSENSPATTQNSLATTQNSPAKFRLFSERASLFQNNSPATLHYSPATTILNENPDIQINTCTFFFTGLRKQGEVDNCRLRNTMTRMYCECRTE